MGEVEGFWVFWALWDPSVGDHQLQGKAYLSPSDTSIDESVKSAQAGKDVSTEEIN